MTDAPTRTDVSGKGRGSSALTILTVIGVVLLVLSIVLAFGLRAAVGGIIRSEEFRDTTARLMERALRPALPRAMVHIGASDLTGKLDAELRDVTLRSSRDVEATLTLTRMTVKPELMSLFLPGPFRGLVTAEIVGGATVTATIAVPRSAVMPETRASGDAVAVQGDANGLSATTLGALLLAENGIAGVKVLQGTTRLHFTYTRVVGGTERQGRIAAQVTDLTLALAADEARAVAFPPLDLALTIADRSLVIERPIVLPDADGQATIAGKIDTPEQADVGMRWDLDVTLTGTPAFAGALPRVWRCEVLPKAAHYRVTGPVSGSHCIDL